MRIPPLSGAMRLLITLAALLATAAPALAAATGWQDLGSGARVRLISTDRVSAEGTTLIAIELDMPQDTKTYWRVPGESGIATELDFTGSTGVSGHRFLWPYPEIEEKAGYTDFVYYGPRVIPVELTLDGPAADLKVSMLMGVCSEVCIPATAAFSLPLDFGEPDAGQEIRISQALADIPIGWTGAGEPVGEPVFDPEAGILWVPVDPAAVDPASLIAEAAPEGYLFGAPQKSPQEGLVGLPLLGKGGEGELAGNAVRLLFVTPEGPYEVERRVGAVGSGN